MVHQLQNQLGKSAKQHDQRKNPNELFHNMQHMAEIMLNFRLPCLRALNPRLGFLHMFVDLLFNFLLCCHV